jgi:hypothetical protein
MANQDMSDEQPSEPKINIDDTTTTKTADEINIIHRHKDSEDSFEQCGVGGSICGANGVLCNSGDIFDSIFPYISQNKNDNSRTMSPRDVRTIVGTDAANITPSSKPIRRGRFLVWPVALDCVPPFSTCSPMAITSSSSSGSE